MASEREKYDKPKSNNSVKHIPKDAQVIMSIMKELNVTEYEPRVINQLLEFTYSMYFGSTGITSLYYSTQIFIFVLFVCFRIRYVHFGRCKSLCESCEEKNHWIGWCEIGFIDDIRKGIHNTTTKRGKETFELNIGIFYWLFLINSNHLFVIWVLGSIGIGTQSKRNSITIDQNTLWSTFATRTALPIIGQL